jgi:hypothetical protein
MDLQSTFYIIGIVFMSLMLILFLALVIAVFVIRAKVVAIHKLIDDKLSLVTDLGAKGAAVFKSIKKVTGKSS